MAALTPNQLRRGYLPLDVASLQTPARREKIEADMAAYDDDRAISVLKHHLISQARMNWHDRLPPEERAAARKDRLYA